MSAVGQRFYCTGARLLARQICHQCLLCRKIQAKAQSQLMGQLPKARITPATPFSTTGVDYCGPFTNREGRGRGLRKLEGYIAVFICFVTKAVHLEPASDQTTGTFLAALKDLYRGEIYQGSYTVTMAATLLVLRTSWRSCRDYWVQTSCQQKYKHFWWTTEWCGTLSQLEHPILEDCGRLQ